MRTKIKGISIKILILMILLFCMTGCGGGEAEIQEEAAVQEDPEIPKAKEEPEEAGIQETDMAEAVIPTVKEIPIDFPFGETERYSLTLALRNQTDGEYELRLYNEAGKVLQQIPCGVLTEPIQFSYDSLSGYDWKNLEIFSDGSSDGLLFEWSYDSERFLENAIIIPRYTELLGMNIFYKEHILTVEDEKTYQLKKIYQFDKSQKSIDEVRRWNLQKDTGALEIWDYVDNESLFEGIVEFDEDGSPVNQEYYDMLFLEGLYDWSDNYDPKVHIGPEYEDGEWHDVEYESKEAFLAEFGFENSTPKYQCYDQHHNLQLELYKDKSTELFCGIVYTEYYVDSKKEKWASMYGFTFTMDDIEIEKWSGDAYSKMSEFNPEGQDFIKDYEETIKYTPNGLPDYFRSQGRAVIQVERGEESLDLMKINYIYRDDGTLFYREYHHSTLVFPTNDQALKSFYDEKGRVIYEDGYITSGDQEYCYIYEGNRDIPKYKLDIMYSHGGVNVYPTCYY